MALSAVGIGIQDLPESLGEIDLTRLLIQATPVPPTLARDKFQPAPQQSPGKSKGTIPAVHPQMFSSPVAAQQSGKLATQAVTTMASAVSGGVSSVLQERTAILEGRVTRNNPDAERPVGKYEGSLKDFHGKQLFTLARFDGDGWKEQGIKFAKGADGSRTFFVKEFGDNKPLSEIDFALWQQQKDAAKIADEASALQNLNDANTDNAAFKQEVIQKALAAGGKADDDTVNAYVNSDQAKEMRANLRSVVTNEQLVANSLGQPAVPQNGTPQAQSGSDQLAPQRPAPPPGPSQPQAAPGDLAPANRSNGKDSSLPMPAPLFDNDWLRRMLDEQDDERDRLRRQDELNDVDGKLSQARNQEAQNVEKLAEQIRAYNRNVEKDKQFEKSEEMLTLLRISHASRLFEGRFSSLAEKTFLTLINSSLVRQPGQSDDQHA